MLKKSSCEGEEERERFQLWVVLTCDMNLSWHEIQEMVERSKGSGREAVEFETELERYQK